MQTITITPQLENGRYFIELPDDLKNRDLIIQIIIKAKTGKAPAARKENSDKLDKINAFAGIAKNSTYQADQELWYQQ